MPLVDMKDMLEHAHRNSYAVGAFAVADVEFLEAILAAAERGRSPVILSLVEPQFTDGDIEVTLAATEAAARRASVPVAIALDRGSSLDSALRAIRHGCNGVMVAASHESFPENVARMRAVVEAAHACGVPVEGELGHVPDPEGEDPDARPGVAYTSVEEAKAYVARTGVDFLAVSIGAAHGRTRDRPRLDLDRLKRINESLGVPLVIRGGAGLADEQLRRLVANGVAKVVCHAALAEAAGRAIRVNARGNGAAGYTALLKGVREAIGAEVERCQRVLGAAGRAAEVLARCRPWQPIARVVLCNLEGAGDADAQVLLARGRDALSKVPGVRRVVSGWALTDKPKYRLCWLVEFAHERAVAGCRDHPDYVAFAHDLLGPIAADQISIDFVEMPEGTETGAAPAHRRHYG